MSGIYRAKTSYSDQPRGIPRYRLLWGCIKHLNDCFYEARIDNRDPDPVTSVREHYVLQLSDDCIAYSKCLTHPEETSMVPCKNYAIENRARIRLDDVPEDLKEFEKRICHISSE